MGEEVDPWHTYSTGREEEGVEAGCDRVLRTLDHPLWPPQLARLQPGQSNHPVAACYSSLLQPPRLARLLRCPSSAPRVASPTSSSSRTRAPGPMPRVCEVRRMVVVESLSRPSGESNPSSSRGTPRSRSEGPKGEAAVEGRVFLRVLDA